MVFDLLAFIGGIAYGYVNPGKEEKGKLLKKGLKIGLGIGIVFGVLNLFVGGLLSFGATIIGSVIGIGFLTLMFICGTLLGGWFGKKNTKVEMAPTPQPSRNVIKEEKIPSKGAVIEKCPHCGGDLSKLNYYQLKAGDSTECEFCGKMITAK